MSYKDFTLEKLNKTFGLTIKSDLTLFPSFDIQVEPEPFFVEFLNYSTKLALSINTEKARSEMIISPILIELKRLQHDKISLFSGSEFNIDSEKGLNGYCYCDFLISRSEQQLYISAPVAVIFEAKNENIKGGLGQCIAAMLAAKTFNEREQNSIESIYGAVTTGNQWKFIQLKGNTAQVDQQDYYIDQLQAIMNILATISE